MAKYKTKKSKSNKKGMGTKQKCAMMAEGSMSRMKDCIKKSGMMMSESEMKKMMNKAMMM